MTRPVWIEIVIVVAVLAAVALWRFTPPRVIAIEAARRATVHLHGDKVMADVSIAPGRASETTLSVFVMTPALERLPAKQVTVRLGRGRMKC